MKTKMSNEKFRVVLIPIIAVICVLGIVLTMAANAYSASLDMALGRGRRHVVKIDGVSPEATEYYDVKFPNPDAGTLNNGDPATEIEEASRNEAAKVALKVGEEGVTLLKNNGVLPLAKNSEVTPFGYRFVSPVWGGAGSAATNMNYDYVVTPKEALQMNYKLNTEVVSALEAARPAELKSSAEGFKDDASTVMTIFEFDPAVYEGKQASCQGTVGVVFIGRLGLEGDDMWAKPYDGGQADHSLQLTKHEKGMIQFAKTNCDKVVVICNFSNIMEIGALAEDNDIDAILWVGNPGAKGLQAMSEIMAGDVNPSGRTVDVWLADQTKDPSWNNVSTGKYTNIAEQLGTEFFEYEEGIYVGYRYYETAAAEAAAGNYTGFDYDKQVVYPFGYGLHYDNERISQKLTGVRLEGRNLIVEGKITNGSSREVKETVQIYLEAPYDRTGSKIEKSAKELIDFGKYTVAANDSVEFSLSISREDFASYDDRGYYTDKGGYVLEAGTYKVYLGKNSHEDWGSDTFQIEQTLVYTDADVKHGARAVGKRPSDGIVVENRFPEINRYIKDNFMTVMSRGDFAGTYPSAPVNKAAPDYVVAANSAYDGKNDAISGTENPDALLYRKDKPASGKDNGLMLSSLRGLGYDDPLWEELLDQIDFKDTAAISAVITYGLYMTQPYDKIGLSLTGDNDGPLGLTATWSGTVGHVVACAWASSPITAATFNEDLIYEMGLAIGQEGLTNGIQGWYAPAVNLHRSAFGGRNFEYYSEDPLLSGRIGAAIVSGARQNGLFAHIKHFALNEMDHSRSNIQVYATEQSMRELYLKGFEICTKTAECTERIYDGETGGQKTVTLKAAGAYMTSMNYVGPVFSGNNYALLTTVLRDEWGFEGFVITDFTSGAAKSKDCGYRVGNDLWMGMRSTELNDLDTATAQWAVRRAIKNIAYTVVNSAAYNGVAPGAYAYYDMSPWKIGLIVFDVIAGLLVAAGIVWTVLRQLDENKNPDKYRKGSVEQ